METSVGFEIVTVIEVKAGNHSPVVDSMMMSFQFSAPTRTPAWLGRLGRSERGPLANLLAVSLSPALASSTGKRASNCSFLDAQLLDLVTEECLGPGPTASTTGAVVDVQVFLPNTVLANLVGQCVGLDYASDSVVRQTHDLAIAAGLEDEIAKVRGEEGLRHSQCLAAGDSEELVEPTPEQSDGVVEGESALLGGEDLAPVATEQVHRKVQEQRPG